MADTLAKARQSHPAQGSTAASQGSAGAGASKNKGKGKNATGRVLKAIISILASHDRDLDALKDRCSFVFLLKSEELKDAI